MYDDINEADLDSALAELDTADIGLGELTGPEELAAPAYAAPVAVPSGAAAAPAPMLAMGGGGGGSASSYASYPSIPTAPVSSAPVRATASSVPQK